MECHRVGVRVDLDDRDLGAVLVRVFVERDQPRLVRGDEVDESRNSLPLVGELPWLEPVGRDEDERARHGASFLAATLPDPLKQILDNRYGPIGLTMPAS